MSLSLFSAELPDVLEKVWLICRNTLDRDPHHGLSTLRSRGLKLSQPFDLPGKQLQVLSINGFLITPEWNQNCSLLSNGACSANVDSIWNVSKNSSSGSYVIICLWRTKIWTMVADNRRKLKLITVSIKWNTCLLIRRRFIHVAHLGLKDKVQEKMEHLRGKKSNILLWHRLKTESNLSQMQLASPSPASHSLRDPQRGNAEATGGKRLSAFGENAEQHRKKEFHQLRIKESMWGKGGRLKDWEKNRGKMRGADFFCQSCS